jgi:hypothetical protein
VNKRCPLLATQHIFSIVGSVKRCVRHHSETKSIVDDTSSMSMSLMSSGTDMGQSRSPGPLSRYDETWGREARLGRRVKQACSVWQGLAVSAVSPVIDARQRRPAESDAKGAHAPRVELPNPLMLQRRLRLTRTAVRSTIPRISISTSGRSPRETICHCRGCAAQRSLRLHHARAKAQ